MLKALAKRVEDRYQSAAAMRSDIERYLAGQPIQAPPPPVAPTDVVPPVDATDHDPRPPRPYPPEDEDRPARAHRADGRCSACWSSRLIAGAAYLLPEPVRVRRPSRTRSPTSSG